MQHIQLSTELSTPRLELIVTMSLLLEYGHAGPKKYTLLNHVSSAAWSTLLSLLVDHPTNTLL
jgi:hypothetical protein